MNSPCPKLSTLGQIAQRLRVPPHRVEYILRTRRHIHPRATAGGTRCFTEEAIAMIRHELAAIEARRSDRQGGQR